MPYFEVRNLEKQYKDFSLLVSFGIEKGDFLTIIGPSGSGKSTLLSLIAGIEEPDRGHVIVNGDYITDDKTQNRGIGMVFQDFSLFPSMNVEKNIRYAMKGKNVNKKDKTNTLLELVGLGGYGKRSVSSLSGGEAQRVALARAIAAEPKILLFDEPLSALDPPMRKHLRSVIRTIHDQLGITMIYVTHDIEEAFAISDTILVMNKGRCITMKSAEELYRKPADLFTAFFTGEGTALPKSLVLEESGSGSIFFRPENASISEDTLNPIMYPMHIVMNDAKVVSVDFTGPNYMLGLEYKGYPVIVSTSLRPRKDTVSVMILKQAVVSID